jgi:TonB family protein
MSANAQQRTGSERTMSDAGRALAQAHGQDVPRRAALCFASRCLAAAPCLGALRLSAITGLVALGLSAVPYLTALSLSAVLASAADAADVPTPGLTAREAQQLEADIARRLALARARRRVSVTSSTRDPELAAYYNAYALRVECISERSYPQAARGRSFRLMVTVSVLADGSLEKAQIDRPSGSADVDTAVLALARSAAPYESFSAALRERYDVLDLGSRWQFAPVKDDGSRAAQCRPGAN